MARQLMTKLSTLASNYTAAMHEADDEREEQDFHSENHRDAGEEDKEMLIYDATVAKSKRLPSYYRLLDRDGDDDYTFVFANKPATMGKFYSLLAILTLVALVIIALVAFTIISVISPIRQRIAQGDMDDGDILPGSQLRHGFELRPEK
jgi:hypothetical protein